MTIDGLNISTYGARQHHVEFGHHSMINDSEWIRGAVLPHFSRSILDFKEFSIDLIVKPTLAQSEQNPRIAISRNIGNILSTLQNDVELVLDGVPNKFRAVLKGHKISELAERRFHKLTLDFSGYEFGKEVTEEDTGEVTIENPGNIMSPVLLMLMPSATATNVTITGICQNPHTGADEPVILGTVTANKLITLDGANGLFTEGEGANTQLKADITIKSMPSISGGEHTITCSQADASMIVRVLPLYM